MKHFIVLVTLALGFFNCSQTPSYDLALKNVKVFNSKTKKVLDHQTVLINADTIAAVVNNNFTFNTKKIIEGNNQLLTPGFIDTHMHLTQIFGDGNEIAPEYISNSSLYQEVLAEQYLAYGTTTIADMGQPEKWMKTTIDWQNHPQPNYPNIFVAGGALKSDYDYEVNMNHVEVMNEENARKKINNYNQLGVNHVKLYAFLNSADMKVILNEAKKRNVNIFGHIDRNEISIPMALDLGLKNFEHFFTLGESVFINEYWNIFRSSYNIDRIKTTDEFAATMTFLLDYINSKPELEKNLNLLIDRLALEKATVSTTIHVLGAVAEETNTFSSFTTFPLRDKPDLPYYTDVHKQKLKKAFNTLMQLLKRAHDKGVKLRIGTDCRYGGEAMLSELILLSKAGFSIEDVLQIATMNGAEALKIDTKYGSIEKGKKADLILFDKNPFEDHNNFISNKIIIKSGEIFVAKKSLPIAMLNIINQKGLEFGISWFQDLKDEFREDELNMVGYKLLKIGKIKEAITIFNLSLNEIPNSKNTYNALYEEQLNIEGYKLLQNGKIKDAIGLFKFNVVLFPKSANAYDSLGEAYLKDGNKEQAIINYTKSIIINTNNTNAIETLKKLNMK